MNYKKMYEDGIKIGRFENLKVAIRKGLFERGLVEEEGFEGEKFELRDCPGIYFCVFFMLDTYIEINYDYKNIKGEWRWGNDFSKAVPTDCIIETYAFSSETLSQIDEDFMRALEGCRFFRYAKKENKK